MKATFKFLFNTLVAVVAVSMSPAKAQVYQPPSAFVSGTPGQNGNATFRYGNGTDITVTVETSATTTGGIYSYGVRVPNSTLGAIGSTTSSNYISATTASLGALVDSWAYDCATPGETQPVDGVMCTDRGSLTLRFSEPVIDPRIHLTGLGTQLDGAPASLRFNTVYTLVSAMNGAAPATATLSALSGNSQFSVGGGVIGSSVMASGIGSSCSGPAIGGSGTAPSASCGSVQVNGTVTSVTFDVSLRTYGTFDNTGLAGFPQSQVTSRADGQVISASIAPLVDLAVTKTNTPTQGPDDLSGDTYTPGESRTYAIVVTNIGPNTVAGATVTDAFPALFTGASWTAVYTGTGASGPASGGGDLNASITLPPGGTATFTVTGTVSASATGTLTNTATVTVPAGMTDPTPGNNDATDTDIPSGSITIVKDAVPNDAQDFAFTTTGTGLSNFSLDDDADATLPNTRTFTGLAPGSYTVTETAQAGWRLTNLVCTDPDSGTTTDFGNGSATIDVDSGEDITCTFTNTKAATLQLRKSWSGAIVNDAVNIPATTGFSSNTTALASVANTATEIDSGTAVNVFPGEVGTLPAETFTTGNAGNYTTTLACSGGGTLSGANAQASNTLTINAADAGATIVCTYTNTRNTATLALAKTWSGAAVNDAATLSTTGAANNATLNSTANSANETDTGATVIVSAAEVITLSETLAAANAGSYTASAWSCTGTSGLAGSTLTVGASDTNIVCAITNTRKTTDVQVVKSALPTTVMTGQVVTYTLTASNNGPGDATNVLLTDTPGPGLDCTTPATTATCSASGGASCPSATVPVSTLTGVGVTIPSLPVGGLVTVTMQCTVTATGAP